jgi:DNA polymerase I-like protein with 3'-5' exonuclease and polymerase domains
MQIILDIETNSAHDKIWCVVCRDLNSDFVAVYRGDSCKDKSNIQVYLNRAEKIITHNGIFFDLPLLKKLWGLQVKKSQVVDTLVMSRLYNPSLEDGHSLAAWGQRLRFPKGDFKDFDNGLTDEMLEYCKQDTLVTAKLYQHLTKEMENDYSQKSIELEHQVAIIIAEQERNGFKLDERGATELLCSLKAKLEAIKVEMESIFPPRVESGRTHKATGKALNDIITPFNPGSRQQIAERLQEKGWKPTKHTEKGSVIVDETTLEGIDIPEAKAIAEYLMLQKRIGQIESWLEAVEADGRVHGRVITNGAVTGRMTHMSPNMAQIPNSSAVYGPECRNLWIVEKGNRLVGIDASGLELRMLAHYMNDDEYTSEVVSGDIHTANQKAAGLETRNQAKTFIYAFLYGAGSPKIGSIVGGGAKEGQKLITSFLRNTPKLKALREKVSRIYSQKGWLPGLDGRKLLVRSEHSSLNTLLQGAGAIVMKQAVVLLSNRLKREKIEHKFCANVHDEWQIETKEETADLVGQYGVLAIEEAGKVLKMRCPLGGEYRTGLTWKDTH